MNIDSAIESFLSWIQKQRDAVNTHDGKAMTPEESLSYPIFYMGREDDLETPIKDMHEELLDRIGQRIPFPFKRQYLFLKASEKSPDELSAAQGVSVSVIKEAFERGEFPDWYVSFAGTDPRTSSGIALTDFEYRRATGWGMVYLGGGIIHGAGNGRLGFRHYDHANTRTPHRNLETHTYSVKETIYHLALIAHPANYIVRESPILTPKETRRVASGKTFPHAKRSRYIIVDHEVLVNRMEPKSTHVTPAPHQRRGHWRRLAERCKHARARGTSHTWVRDCKVGETDFVANNRRYQVLMDFHNRYGMVTV